VSRRVLHTGRVGTFALEDVELPGGRRMTLEILHHPGAAAVVPFVAPDRIVLLHQYRFAAGGRVWEVPAGKLEPGEPPERCAARELEEETGWRAGRLVRTGEILPTPGFTDERIHLFCAYDLEPGRRDHQPDEVIETHEVELARAMAMIDSGELVDGKSIAALYHAWRRRAAGGNLS
jgi:ADP-ribose pyrophosphatase